MTDTNQAVNKGFPVGHVSLETAKKQLSSYNMAANCRYNASVRLKYRSTVAFSTTTALSLGLIFIPLMKNAQLQLSFSSEVLSMLQLFLAVLVLVYSIINSQARYGIRAIYLNACGDEIKDLCKTLSTRVERAKARSENTVKIDDIREKYSNVKVDVENHTQADYGLARLALGKGPNEWYRKIYIWCSCTIKNFIPHLLSVFILISIFSIILDMLGVTAVLSPIFQEIQSPLSVDNKN